MMSALLELRNLRKSFGPFTAVDGISFSVQRGEVLGFLGPNGAGKTTTMRMVAGYLPPSGGTALIEGIDVQDHPTEIKRRLGYLPEGAPLYGEMTVRGLLGFVSDTRGLAPAFAKSRTEYVIERLHLDSVLPQQVETLSKGFKRRVGLALAILHDPVVLVLDEPTDGLDPNQKHEVRSLIREMAEDKAIVISTHILEEVDAVCSRAVIIAEGKMRVDGTPGQLLGQGPTSGGTRLFVGGVDRRRLRAALMDIAGVTSLDVEREEDDVVVVRLVLSERKARARESVLSAVEQAGGNVVKSEDIAATLDDVFRSLTAGDNL